MTTVPPSSEPDVVEMELTKRLTSRAAPEAFAKPTPAT